MSLTCAPSLMDRLLAAGHLIASGVDGVYGRSGAFEGIVERVGAMLTRLAAADRTEVFRFPPGMAEAQYVRSGHYASFPQLAGTVHCFCGDERTHRRALQCMAAGQDWTEGQVTAGIVMTPAACYPVYPILARRGPVPEGGYLVDLSSWCFRHEPSLEPTRMQMFQMREFVRVGTRDQVVAFRGLWIERISAMFDQLSLPFGIEVANDPFFGRAGQIMADSQRSQQLKFELVVPVNDGAPPTACVSFNYHMDHFGEAWGMDDAAGDPAQTACIGFGLDRTTLALLKHHGLDPAAWPTTVRQALWGDA